MSDELELMAIRIKGVKEAIGMVNYHFGHLMNRTLAAEALAASRLKLLREVKQLLDTIYAEDIVSSGDLGKVYEKITKELGE